MKHLIILLLCLAGLSVAAQSFSGPLRVHPQNPRYFTDNSGKVI